MLSRSIALLGEESMIQLQSKRIILFGIGGVGSWCAECLIRTGLIHLTIVDDDTVQPSNLNRQLPATQATLGRPKVEALKERLLSINPQAEITALQKRYEPSPACSTDSHWQSDRAELFTRKGKESFDFHLEDYDYIIDAIDDVQAKADLIYRASRVRALKVYSSMGAALRFDPTKVTTGELMDIKGDALAKAVRARMKRLNLKPYKKIRCVYSTEQAQRCETRGSLMQVTAVFGLTLASMVVNDIKKGALC